MKTRAIAVFLVLSSMAMFYGCGGDPPTAEMDAATQALQEARAAGAEKFAPSQLAAAQSAYDEAKAALESEQQKMFKDFEKVKPLIADARSKADAAKSAAQQAKGRAKSSAESVIADAAAAIQQARASLDLYRQGKPFRSR